jgi:aspartate racemase
MKTIGLLGGMSWESTVLYYQLLNLGVRERLGGLHSAPILLHSVDFAEIDNYQVPRRSECRFCTSPMLRDGRFCGRA